MTLPIAGPEIADRAAEFHGELCPGLAMGVQAARLAVERLGREGLVAVAETDICALDAIQAITGCTMGNRNLIHLDYGKNVYTFFRRSDRKAIRISGRPAWDPAYQALRTRVNAGLASAEEKAALEEATADEARRILNKDPEDLYDVTDVHAPLPATSQVDPWLNCARCGEAVMETRARRLRGEEYCQPCLALLRAKAS